MGLAESELAQSAGTRFDLTTIGADAFFLADRRTGHRLYMGSEQRLTHMEQRRYLASLQHDIRTLTVGEFFEKYGLTG